METKVIKGKGEKKSYVVEGATLKCNQGDKKSELCVTPSHGIYIRDKAQANINDFVPMKNIKAFGKCKSLANPTVAAATAANKGKLKKRPCIPAITMQWISGKTDVLIGKFPALLNTSTIMCAYAGKITIEKDGQG